MAHSTATQIRVIIASQFAPPFMFSAVAIVLPAMGSDLHSGAIALGLVETLFLACQLAVLLPVGRIADAADKVWLYKAAIFIFGLSSLLIGLSGSMPFILFLRCVQGIASAMFGALGMAILADLVPRERRGKVFGSSIGAIYAGLTFGPVCAGLIADAAGWRLLFYITAAVFAVMFYILHRIMPARWQNPGRGVVHWPSAGLIVLSVFLTVLGCANTQTDLPAYLSLAGGFAFGAAFVLLQRRLANPLLNITLLMANRPMRNALLVQTLLYLNAFSTIFLLNLYLQVTLGNSARAAGTIIAVGSLLMALAAPVAGRLADRYRPRLIASVGVVFVLVATIMGLFMQESGTYIAVLLAVQSTGFALFSSPNMKIIMNAAPEHALSMASALGAKARSLGMVFGMLVATLLISHAMGHDSVYDHGGQMPAILYTAFVLLTGTTLVALAFSFFTRNHTQST